MKNKTVFISGSRSLKHLDDNVINRLENIINKKLSVIVGDCYGADLLIQHYFHGKGYRDVTVYYAGKIRNNYGNFPTVKVSDSNIYAMKDSDMTEKCDFGFVIYDGDSPGSTANIKRLREMKKPFIVYDFINEIFTEN
jgi:adenine-specific DNA-methyltransferase